MQSPEPETRVKTQFDNTNHMLKIGVRYMINNK